MNQCEAGPIYIYQNIVEDTTSTCTCFQTNVTSTDCSLNVSVNLVDATLSCKWTVLQGLEGVHILTKQLDTPNSVNVDVAALYENWPIGRDDPVHVLCILKKDEQVYHTLHIAIEGDWADDSMK